MICNFQFTNLRSWNLIFVKNLWVAIYIFMETSSISSILFIIKISDKLISKTFEYVNVKFGAESSISFQLILKILNALQFVLLWLKKNLWYMYKLHVQKFLNNYLNTKKALTFRKYERKESMNIEKKPFKVLICMGNWVGYIELGILTKFKISRGNIAVWVADSFSN